MKKLIQFLTLLLLAGGILGGLPQARASHIQGGQLTYRALGNNQYEVTLAFFRDCSGIDLPTTATLNTQQGSCTGPTGPTATMNIVPGSLNIGTPYCASSASQAQCRPTDILPNYQTQLYRATITLPPASLWILSVTDCCRPTIANSTGTNFRYEATLNNQLVVPGQGPVTIQNTSPQYSVNDVPIPFVIQRQSTTVTFATSEPDGDSLVYALDAPLESCGVNSTYKPLGSNGGSGIVPIPGSNPPCYLQLPTATGSFTPTLPIRVAYDTTGTCPIKTATNPRFRFNASLGQFTFTPAVWFNTAPVVGDNKYVVVGKVSEYRRLPGTSRRRYLVGSVRREILVIVINGAGNLVPIPPVVVVPDPLSGAVPTNGIDTTSLRVRTCNYTSARFTFTDPDNTKTPPVNPLQNLTVTYTGNTPIDDLLQNGDIGTYVLTRNGTPTPEARLFLQPGAAFAGTVIRLPFRIEDNACPTKGVQNRIIEIKIVREVPAQAVAVSGTNNLLAGVLPATICGGSVTIQGRVQRPDSIRDVVRNVSVLQRYRYDWKVLSGDSASIAGNSVASNIQNITVTPRKATRYQLQITPQSGFGPNGGGCGDTTSILVRVVPTLRNQFIVRDSLSSRPRTNANVRGALVPPVTYLLRNTTTLLPASSPYVIGNIEWTYQRVKDGSGNAVNDQPVLFSNRFQPGDSSLVLTLGGTYIIRLSSTVNLKAPGAPASATCPVTVAQRTVVVPNVEVPNIITPNNDGLNDVFVVRPELQGGKLEIYNRWGRKMEEFGNYQNTWGAANQATGVYYYFLTDKGGNKTKGWIEVVK